MRPSDRWMILAALVAALAPTAAAQQEIRFNRDIRPILSENCFHCHGPDGNARQAGLRLDRREQAMEKGAIAPGDTAASSLIARIRSEQEALLMPPAWSDKKLTEAQKELLTRWVQQGAAYEMHWAYIPPERPEAPAGPAAIDALLGRELEKRGLSPADRADRVTLARRLSFDVTGLPPTEEAVQSFVEDRSDDAYKKFVNGLLDSPRFGERMAVHWLDLVRYADTVGFHSDVPVNVSPYRDYVIKAFNENLPFDQFTREQLAGDLLLNPTDWQLVASAYNRLSRMTNEGGAQAKEYLIKYAGDRVRTTATVWLGSTLSCAECHDHKFDPYTTRDYYSLSAFFADIEEEGVYGGRASFGPSVWVLSDETKREIAEIDAKLAKLKNAGQAADRTEFAAALRANVESWQALEPLSVRNDCSHPDIEGCSGFDWSIQTDGFVRIAPKADKAPPREALVRSEFQPEGPITALMLEAVSVPRFRELELSEFEVRILGRSSKPIRVGLETLIPDEEGGESMLRNTIDDNHHTVWGGGYEDGARRAVFRLTEPVTLGQGERLEVATIYNGRTARKVAGRFRIWASDSPEAEIPVEGWLRSAVLNEETLFDEESRALDEAFSSITNGNPNWREIRRLELRRKTLTDQARECVVSRAVEDPRTIRVLPRGNWMDDSGQIVEPQSPEFLRQIRYDGPRADRLDLANWLVSRDNPLTARVFVNRLWNIFFGTGLSKNLDDVGSQGETPVHQALLDWLAVEFMESGWDVKHVVRTMLLSEAYQRSSQPTEALAKADPYNRLHGRQSMYRLDAEFIRDNALAVSGLLNPKIGGVSAKPYQPAGYYRELNFPKREYEPDYNADQFRRGLYTHWQRTFLHPSLMAFDAPTREDCTAERTVSNTPLQSLTLLNDPSYVEAARAFAARILLEAPDVAGRIDFAFREAFSRGARPAEREVLAELIRDQQTRFAADPARADALLAVGISPLPRELERSELAAWTMAARALFNKHEFVMRY